MSQITVGWFDRGKKKNCLMVTHGGWIYELMNFIGMKENNDESSLPYKAKNCCVTIIRLRSKSTPEEIKSIKSVSDVDDQFYSLEVLLDNDTSHLGEDKKQFVNVEGKFME